MEKGQQAIENLMEVIAEEIKKAVAEERERVKQEVFKVLKEDGWAHHPELLWERVMKRLEGGDA